MNTETNIGQHHKHDPLNDGEAISAVVSKAFPVSFAALNKGAT